jgi:hypothetical protein
MSLGLGAQQYRWAIFSISINVHGGRATRGARSMLWLLTGSTRGLIVRWLPLCCIFPKLRIELEMLVSGRNADLTEDEVASYVPSSVAYNPPDDVGE